MKFISIILLSFVLISSANAAQPIISSNLIAQGSGPTSLPPIEGARVKLALKVQLAQTNVIGCANPNTNDSVSLFDSLNQLNAILDFNLSSVIVNTADPKHPVVNVQGEGQPGLSVDFTLSENLRAITLISASTMVTQIVTVNTGTILNPVFQQGNVTSLNPVYVCQIQ